MSDWSAFTEDDKRTAFEKLGLSVDMPFNDVIEKMCQAIVDFQEQVARL